LLIAPFTGSPFPMDSSRLAVATVALSSDLRTALERARTLGVRGVEIDARGGLDPEQVSQTGLRQIRKWLDDAGLVVAAVAFRTRGGYADADRLEGRIAATKRSLELAHDLGAQVVLNQIGDVPPPATDPEAEPDPQWRLLIDVLTDLGSWGQRVGATLCAEAGRAGPDDLLRVIASLPEGSLRCDLVTGALVVHRHDPVEAIEKLSGHIGYVHATDAVGGAFTGRGRAAVLGTGHVDLAAVFGTLEERGYRGWIGLEPAGERGGVAELTAAVQFLHGM
jgi:sugar phosphate isomerase/epimerase